MTPKLPHILYILSDQHRGQAMRHQGDVNVRTPHMDALAAGGASFRRAYANCPVCTPSRGTIFSGRHAHCGPVPTFFSAFPPSAPSTATWLSELGYHTSYIGKWHCGIVHNQKTRHVLENAAEYPGVPTRTPEDRRGGFEDWAAFEVINAPFKTYLYRGADENPTSISGYQTDVLTSEAIRQLKAYERDEPLFMVLSVEPPHFPCLPPEDTPLMPPETLKVDPSFARLNPMFADTFPEIDEMTLRQILANYYAMVENLDKNIGRIIETLRSLPQFADTLVVYISDHGDYVGNHGMQTCKIHHHEESIRVPAIFYRPGHIPAQNMIDGLFGLVDLQATVCGLVGAPIPSWNQGRDWSSHLLGNPTDMPEDILIEMNGAPRWTPRFMDWRGVVSQRWKYAFYENGREFLHDLENDPFEMDNVIRKHPEIATRYKARLLKWLRETREPFFDVLIEHGVPPKKAHYLRDDATQIQNARILGGLETPLDHPLPMA